MTGETPGPVSPKLWLVQQGDPSCGSGHPTPDTPGAGSTRPWGSRSGSQGRGPSCSELQAASAPNEADHERQMLGSLRAHRNGSLYLFAIVIFLLFVPYN